MDNREASVYEQVFFRSIVSKFRLFVSDQNFCVRLTNVITVVQTFERTNGQMDVQTK